MFLILILRTFVVWFHNLTKYVGNLLHWILFCPLTPIFFLNLKVNTSNTSLPKSFESFNTPSLCVWCQTFIFSQCNSNEKPSGVLFYPNLSQKVAK